MTLAGWLQTLAFFAVVLALTKPLGVYFARVFEGESTWLSPVLRPLERGVYRLCGIDESSEMNWKQYAIAVIAFSFVGFVYLYVLLRVQKWLPLNPSHFENMPPDLAWNTAISFLTNTNWQFYSGETSLSYLSQMAGLAWHNFVSAAAGVAIAVAVVRGITRASAQTIGNFWVDMVRALLYVFAPGALIAALLLVSQGVPQNFEPYRSVTTLEGARQTLTGGPMASQEAIKELGTNGGGFVNANSASPNENPTPLSNFIELVLIFSVPAGLVYMYGRMAGDTRQGWAIFAAMSLLFAVGFAATSWAESSSNPLVAQLGVHGANMEGKEVRFGVAASALFATVTTDTSCGAVNAMHDSFLPLGGLVPLIDMQLGEIVFGGVGSGLYGMLMFVALTVFIAGLMVGRTPELLGKKIERREVQYVILSLLITPVLVLIPAALAVLVPPGTGTLTNAGPHGFSEVLYAFTSTNANNGSAFAGLGGNTFYNVATGLTMLFGRFAVIVPVLAFAGSMAQKKRLLQSSGTFTTTSPIFVTLLLGTIVIVGALTFLPADALGPIAEHLVMLQGKQF